MSKELREIKGYEGVYAVTNTGRVFSRKFGKGVTL